MLFHDYSGLIRCKTALKDVESLHYLPMLSQVVEKTIRPCLIELSEDPDVDVRFFATQALKLTDQAAMSS